MSVSSVEVSMDTAAQSYHKHRWNRKKCRGECPTEITWSTIPSELNFFFVGAWFPASQTLPPKPIIS